MEPSNLLPSAATRLHGQRKPRPVGADVEVDQAGKREEGVEVAGRRTRSATLLKAPGWPCDDLDRGSAVGAMEGGVRERTPAPGKDAFSASRRPARQRRELVVAGDSATVTLLNRYPYNTGHLLVAPRQHVPDLLAAGDDGAAALMVAARRAMRALQRR